MKKNRLDTTSRRKRDMTAHYTPATEEPQSPNTRDSALPAPSDPKRAGSADRRSCGPRPFRNSTGKPQTAEPAVCATCSRSEKPAERPAVLVCPGQITSWVDGLSIARFRQRRFLRTAIAVRVAQRYAPFAFLCGCTRCHIRLGALMKLELSNNKSRRGGQETPTSALPAPGIERRERRLQRPILAGDAVADYSPYP